MNGWTNGGKSALALCSEGAAPSMGMASITMGYTLVGTVTNFEKEIKDKKQGMAKDMSTIS